MKDILNYDRQAMNEIHFWKDPISNWAISLMSRQIKQIDLLREIITDSPGVRNIIQATSSGLVDICNDFSHWSIYQESILKEFRNDGHHFIHCIDDINSLSLKQIDRMTACIAAKYKSIALTANSQAVSYNETAALLADMPTLITLNLKAIVEYATYYGFDIIHQNEMLFALNILSLSYSLNVGQKSFAIKQLTRIAQDVAKKIILSEFENHAVVEIIQKIVQQLGSRITKAKLAEVITIGREVAVGYGGFGVYFTSETCDAAYYLYRERFLANKYGSEVIDEDAFHRAALFGIHEYELY